MKNLKTIFLLLLFCTGLAADDIAGFWKVVDDKTGNTQCIVAVYEYQDRYYGRIIGTYDKNGVMDDTIYDPKDRAPGVKGNPFYCGMDIIWNLHDIGSRYKGKIIDPEKGRTYKVELWVRDTNLIVRGEVLIFGRNQVWPPAPDTIFSKEFPKPDVATFVPVIPQVN